MVGTSLAGDAIGEVVGVDARGAEFLLLGEEAGGTELLLTRKTLTFLRMVVLSLIGTELVDL